MTVLPPPTRTSPSRRAAAWRTITAGLLAAALLGAPGAALAEEEEQLTFEERMIRSLLGSRPSIDYRERSPLVIPPSTDLPAPDARASVSGNASWPQDPDRRRRASGSSGLRSPFDQEQEAMRPLTPDELRRGTSRTRAGANRSQGPVRNPTEYEAGRPLSPAELGETRSLFGLITRAVTPEKIEPFSGEPERQRLTQPPTGYRTPSTTQPYAPPDKGRAARKVQGFDPAAIGGQ